jgi:hypothetical protein
MAERIILKARVAGVDFSDVITSEAGIATAAWEEQPVTLRDDEISIVEGDPEESDIYSHENDAPEDYDVSGTGVTAVGSFIKANFTQMAELMGGTVKGEDDAKMYLHPSAKTVLTKAIRFRQKNGGSIIIPCAKGSVQFSSNNGYDGVMKFPFRFRALAQVDFDTDLIIQ